MKDKIGTVYGPIEMKDGKIQLPKEVIEDMELQPGETLSIETNTQHEVILKKLDTEYKTIPIPTEYFEEIEELLKEKQLDMTVDEVIRKALYNHAELMKQKTDNEP